MKEVEVISLGGMVIALEQDAKPVLHKYLEKNRTAINDEEAADEIMQDLELAIASHLIEKGFSEKRAASKSIVEEVIEAIGDIDASSKPSSTSKDWREWFQTPFRLSKTNSVMFGICGGLAERIGIDAFWIRILFVLLAFMTDGWFVGFYFIAGIILSIIEEDDAFSKPKATRLKSVSAQAAKGTKGTLMKIDSYLRKLLRALVVMLSSLGFVVALSVASVALVSMIGRPELDMPLIGTTRSALSYIFVGSSALFLVWAFGLLLYTSVFPKKNDVSRSGWSMFVVILPTVVLMSASMTSAVYLRDTIKDWARRHPGNGVVEIRQSENGNIESVCVSPLLTCDDPLDVRRDDESVPVLE